MTHARQNHHSSTRAFVCILSVFGLILPHGASVAEESLPIQVTVASTHDADLEVDERFTDDDHESHDDEGHAHTDDLHTEHGHSHPSAEGEQQETQKGGGDGDHHGHTHSIGKPQLGALVNGVALAGGDRISVRKKRNYGTPELIDLIEAAVAKVHEKTVNAPKLHVGDLSFAHGGPIGRHLSHQSGRDADIGYYLRTGHAPGRFKRATAKTLDVERTWILFEALLSSGQTEVIFSDKDLIRALRDHAERSGETHPDHLARWFDGAGPGRRPLIRHLDGHANHLHLRVKAPNSRSDIGRLASTDDTMKVRDTLAKAKVYRAKIKGKKITEAPIKSKAKRRRPTLFVRSAATPAPMRRASMKRRFRPRTQTANRARDRAKAARIKARKNRLRRRQDSRS